MMVRCKSSCKVMEISVLGSVPHDANELALHTAHFFVVGFSQFEVEEKMVLERNEMLFAVVWLAFSLFFFLSFPAFFF